MLSAYLSDDSILKKSCNTMFLQPFEDGVRNFRSICTPSTSYGRKISHFAMGIGLSLPLINVIIFLVTKALILHSYSHQKQPPPFEAEILFAEKFICHIFNAYTSLNPNLELFEVVKNGDDLFVKSTDLKTEISLKNLIRAIAWKNLPKEWEGLTKKQLDIYKIQTLIRSKKETLDSLSETAQKIEGLREKYHPFIVMYTQDLYSLINTVLREGKIPLESFNTHKNGNPDSQKELVPYSSLFSEMLESLLGIDLTKEESPPSSNSSDITRFVKEILFISLLVTGSLQVLKPKSAEKLHRVLTLSTETLNLWKLAEITHQPITDRGFCSTSFGGKFKGGPSGQDGKKLVHCTIHHSKTGRDLSAIGLGGEEEFLFGPFSSFKILNIVETGSKVSIDLEEAV